jgi:acyl carrier protein
MEKQKLIEKVNEILADEFEVNISEITSGANIKKTLQLDSLSLVDMVALIEDNFSVSIKGVEVANIQTFGSLYEFVFDRMQ